MPDRNGPRPRQRRAGVLIPLFSIRTRSGWGLGEIPDLVALACWAARSGIRVVQMLPVGAVTGGETSPYSAATSFAIDPVYLGLDACEDFRRGGRPRRARRGATRLGRAGRRGGGALAEAAAAQGARHAPGLRAFPRPGMVQAQSPRAAACPVPRAEPGLDRRLGAVRRAARQARAALAGMAQGPVGTATGGAGQGVPRARRRHLVCHLAAVAARRAVAGRARRGGEPRRRPDGGSAVRGVGRFGRRVEGAQAVSPRPARRGAAGLVQRQGAGLGFAALRLGRHGTNGLRVDAPASGAPGTALRALSRRPRDRHVPHVLADGRRQEVGLLAHRRRRPDPTRRDPARHHERIRRGDRRGPGDGAGVPAAIAGAPQDPRLPGLALGEGRSVARRPHAAVLSRSRQVAGHFRGHVGNP